MVDPTGEIAILTCVLIGAGIGLLLGGATGAYISYKKFNEVRWKYVLIGAAAGAAIKAAVAFIKVMNTVKTINKFTVSAKHLANGGGNWAKFNTTSQNTVRDWIRTAILKGKPIPNNQPDSYVIIYNMGKVIGKKGEKCIKVVYNIVGKIWTAFPVK